MIRACLYIIRYSIKNAVVSKVKRLKEPKYALALVVGLAYFGFFFGRGFFHAAAARGSMSVPAGFLDEYFGWGAIILGLLYLVIIWFFKAVDPGLLFKPAEVHYLFTAPATRRQVIHYYLLRAQPGVVLTTLFFGLFGAIWMPFAQPIYALVAVYLIINVVLLHQTAASLVRASVFRHGAFAFRGQIVSLVVMLVIVAFAVAQARTLKTLPFLQPKVIEAFLRDGLDSPVAYFGLYPLRALGLLLVSRDLGTFLWHLVPVAGLLALHYMWVIHSDVAFEEASQARSRQVAERIERVRKGRSPFARVKTRATGQPFRLGPHGPALTAIFWKNMISLTRIRFALLLLVPAAVGIAVWAGLTLSGEPRQVYTIPFAVVTAVASFLLLFLPQMLRKDLRQDLPYLDILKTLPVSGVHVIVGEILAPLAVSTCVQILLGSFCVLFAVSAGVASLGEGLSVFLTVSLIYPFFAALWLLVDHVMLLHFPDWVPRAPQQRQGIEFLGSNIVYFLMVFFALGLLLMPSIILAAVAIPLALLLLGVEIWPLAIVSVAVPVAIILAVECAVLLRFAGRKYEAFDFSTEITSLSGS